MGENWDLKINCMFNPLSLLKKKSAEPSGLEAPAAEPVVEQPVQIDDIVIHTMPERFRHQTRQTDSAKTTGLLIIGGGAVFLIAISVALYFYLFKAPAAQVNQEQPAPAANTSTSADNSAQPGINQAPVNSEASTLTETSTSTEATSMPADNGLATSTATSTPNLIEQQPPAGLIPSLDSDQDGLSDAEEILLGTSTSTPDTDGDGYLDGAELLNLYDPASSTGKLITNANISWYQNKTFNYSVLYPRAWQLSSNGGDDSIMFKSLDNQFLQIIVQPNTAKQTLDQWFIDQMAVTTINDSDRISGTGWQGIKNLDGLTVYLMDTQQNYIYTLAYNPGENNILDYIHIFNMMVKSFTLQ
jgi:hypothetical protein